MMTWQHMFFATDPRIADSYAKPWPMKVKHGGCYQKNIIVSRIIMSQDSHVTVTGCTGGTVKVRTPAERHLSCR